MVMHKVRKQANYIWDKILKDKVKIPGDYDMNHTNIVKNFYNYI